MIGYFLFCFILLLEASAVDSIRRCPSGDAIIEWKKYLNVNFYSVKQDVWDKSDKKKNIGLFNNQYVTILSDIMNACKDVLYFASFGACDGTSDKTIESFMQNGHWRGVLVEAFPANVAELTQTLTQRGALQRSLVLEAAAMDQCDRPTVSLRSPVANPEDLNKPHWLRRQSSSVVTEEQKAKNKRFPDVWKLADVRCITGLDVMQEFDRRFSDEAPPPPSSRRRADILKIDVEGASVPVLRSVLSKPASETSHGQIGQVGSLPLVIMVEVKTSSNRLADINEGCSETVKLLEAK